MNSGSVSCLWSLDISAFDVLDHQALLKRARTYLVLLVRYFFGSPPSSQVVRALFLLGPPEQVVLYSGARCHQYADDT